MYTETLPNHVTRDCTSRFHHAKSRQNVTTATHGIQMVNVSPEKDGCHVVQVNGKGLLTKAHRLDIPGPPGYLN